MEHLLKLLRDSYDLQEEKSEESAYWHLQQLRSEIKQLTLTDVVSTCCEPVGEGFYLGTSCKKCKQPFRQNLK